MPTLEPPIDPPAVKPGDQGPGERGCSTLVRSWRRHFDGRVPVPEIVLSHLSEHECWERLQHAEVGRLVVSVDALPLAFPVNFRLVERRIIFLTAPGTKLTAAVSGAVVGFEVDDIALETHTGWSVMVAGVARVVHDPTQIAVLGELGIRSWLSTPTPHYVAIGIERISGRYLAESSGVVTQDDGLGSGSSGRG